MVSKLLILVAVLLFFYVGFKLSKIILKLAFFIMAIVLILFVLRSCFMG